MLMLRLYCNSLMSGRDVLYRDTLCKFYPAPSAVATGNSAAFFHACEVWAPASACIGPFRDLQQLQRTFLRRPCHVKERIPVEIIFQELQQMRWHDFWWRRVTSFWSL